MYFQTIRHLKLVQVYGRLRFRFSRPKMADLGTPQRRARTGVWVSPVVRGSSRIGENRFRFLNDERDISTWNDARVPKLWLYNLHYFDAPDAGLVQRWIAENPVGQGNGWEPYPLSRRIVNWIQWRLAGNELGAGADASLAMQANYLSQRIEYHLQANHLFANAKALVFAGAFFEGSAAARWLAKGLGILEEQMGEQILRDGAHYELSTLYHALVLEDVLDLINLRRAYAGLIPDWSEAAGRMLKWLRQMTHPDGQIGLFNDAAFGIAGTPGELRAYGERLGIAVEAGPPSELCSGYWRLERGETVVLFDTAAIGPDHQPGHAHADTLSLEVSHRGRRVLVNSGTSTYETGLERERQRGTAAHNTIRLDGLDQSEMWSAFRVARRARPLDALFEDGDEAVSAGGGHDGYKRLRCPVIHKRELKLTGDYLEITDRLQGKGQHRAEVFFHVHPEVAVEAVDRNTVRLSAGGMELAILRLDEGWVMSDELSTYHPEFGTTVASRKVVGRWAGSCPVEFVTRLELR